MAEKHLHVPGHVSFAAAGHEDAGKPFHQPLVEATGSLHPSDFVRVLDDAQAFREPVGPHEAASRTGQRPRERLVKIERDGFGFETHIFARRKPADEPGDILGHIRPVNANAFRLPQPPGGVEIARVRGDPVLAVGHDDQTPGAFVQLRIVQFKTGKVIAIGGMTDQKRVYFLFAHQRPQTFAALLVRASGHGDIRFLYVTTRS